jgi:hypothetical protein
LLEAAVVKGNEEAFVLATNAALPIPSRASGELPLLVDDDVEVLEC